MRLPWQSSGLRLCASTAGDAGSTPCKILHATWHGQQGKKCLAVLHDLCLLECFLLDGGNLGREMTIKLYVNFFTAWGVGIPKLLAVQRSTVLHLIISFRIINNCI